ncbi:LacI family DNA-binding transcriptional regulator [Arthrobacter sp. NPDC090010]|uniref:LacI family DNA-binding transcriptional regulator n=1 Tax=Arthrobacter sp. NPDC090010 TaxID=3363942 RepID=UPI00382FD615
MAQGKDAIPAGRPTVSSVAAYAGVSRQTVSNALNNPERLQPETLERVLTAIRDTGYVRSAAARQMRTSRSRTLGFRLEPVRDGIGGAVLDSFLHSLAQQAEEHQYRITLYTADSDASERRQFERLTREGASDGFVLFGTHASDSRYEWLAERGIPYAVFGRPWDLPEAGVQHPWVDVDGAAGTAAATRHLLELGHRRIGFIGWPEGSGTGADRQRGWQETLSATGLGASDVQNLVTRDSDGILEGGRAARALSERGATAFVCASDSLAIGAYQASGAAVVGFDDSPTAAAIGLSSVSQPVQDCASRVLDAVFTQLDGGGPGAPAVLQPTLVVRDSSRALD